ncbi:hypothetical protein [Acaryochloris sp. CCMEE 5410]|uniref:hypothetical protein n=1 Tax=Acaryochloris sp. CCMEE 5410 TaxID=310037 RepID=UPI0002484947|nr:hypothetical protein [Acaryochloris sp. CCMEE 5410]KAI9131655.1 hypothetical protein ON05_029165 [Acaryochloris sp. CCMEE 5410]
MQEQDLADFQSFLLETLSTHDIPEKILAELSSQPLDQDLASYLNTLDPNMVDVAATLVKKWGQRRL